jgi:hypothetical protein
LGVATRGTLPGRQGGRVDRPLAEQEDEGEDHPDAERDAEDDPDDPLPPAPHAGG